MGVLRRTESGGVLHIELSGAPFDAGIAAELEALIPPPDDLAAPPVLLVTAPADGDFAPLGPAAQGGLPPGLRDGGPGGTVTRCVDRLAGYAGITVAALCGETAGCGAELALAFDLRVAAAGAALSFPHVRHQRVPAGGATQRLPRLAGPGAAARALLLGEPLATAELAACGLVTAVLPDGAAAVAEAAELAASLAAQSAPALRACKEAVLAGADLPLREGLRLEADLAVLLQTTNDRAEGVRAFLEKRPPRFEGR